MQINLSLQENWLSSLYKEEGKEEKKVCFGASAAGGMEVSAVTLGLRLHWVFHLQRD